MKKLFIVCCDIMVIAFGIGIVAMAVWVISALAGVPAGPAKIVCISAFVTAVIACVASYAAWLHGGAPDDTEEGDR